MNLSRFRIIRSLLPALTLVAAGAALVPANAADPLAGAPAAGTCYDLTIAQVDKPSASEDTVACTKQHTIWVTGSVALPDGVPADSSKQAYVNYATTTCQDLRRSSIGDDDLQYAESAYTITFFLPTQAQRADGARWVSCGVMLVKGGSNVRSARETPRPLADPMPDAIELCQDSQFRTTPCTTDHKYRVTYATTLTGKSTYANWQKAAAKTCPSKVKTNRWSWSAKRLGPNSSVLACLNKNAK